MERGFAHFHLNSDQALDSEAQARLLELADGDGRRLLNSVEQIAPLFTAAANKQSTDPQLLPLKPLSVDDLEATLGGRTLYYDRDRDQHYDTISAFIKSVRGSDPDAALYYLARMLKGGEDPKFVARRLVVLASEDVGNADPRALTVAISGLQAVELVGLPEAAINLAQVTTYLASAPKSNRSYEGWLQAQAEVEKSGFLPIPLALRSAKTPLMKNLGYGKDYQYSHLGPKGWVPQQFLPDAIHDARFYEPVDRGFEKNIRQYLEWVKTQKLAKPSDM
jgi:putative ATPase